MSLEQTESTQHLSKNAPIARMRGRFTAQICAALKEKTVDQNQVDHPNHLPP